MFNNYIADVMSRALQNAEVVESREFASTRQDQQTLAVDAKIAHYEEELARLGLVCMAMWSLLKEKTGLTEEDLMKRVQEIDLTDGKLDGQVRYQVANCPQCGRAITIKHNRCLYCGFTPEQGDFAAFRYVPAPPGEKSE